MTTTLRTLPAITSWRVGAWKKVATNESTQETFKILGFDSEYVDELHDLELSRFDHSNKSTEYYAEWRVSKDGGRIKATWISKNSQTCLRAIYIFSIEEHEKAFGPGDYSCSEHSYILLNATFPNEEAGKYGLKEIYEAWCEFI
jgi:hypothetical protein